MTQFILLEYRPFPLLGRDSKTKKVLKFGRAPGPHHSFVVLVIPRYFHLSPLLQTLARFGLRHRHVVPTPATHTALRVNYFWCTASHHTFKVFYASFLFHVMNKHTQEVFHSTFCKSCYVGHRQTQSSIELSSTGESLPQKLTPSVWEPNL